MTRPLDRHLEEEELEALASALELEVPSPHQFATSPDDEIQLHLGRCEACSRRVRMYEEAHAMLRGLKTGGYRKETRVGCPEDVDWTAVAAGLSPPEQAMPLMDHAARCAHCGALLKMAAEDLSDEATPEEEALLERLDGGSASWQAAMAQQLSDCTQAVSAPAEAKRSVVILWPRLLLAAAAVPLLVVGGMMAVRSMRPSSPLELVAKAYPEHRTLELRIAGAANAPIHVERGAGSSNLDKPASLLRAEALISEALRKHPNDWALMQRAAQTC